MTRVLPIALSVLLVACGKISPSDATRIAADRLSAMPDGPSVKGDALLRSLSTRPQSEGKYLVEMTDAKTKTMWAVIVMPSGESEVSKMAVEE
jgi:hypothetical protein